MERPGANAEDVEYWKGLARYDLETADAMLESGRYLYVLFTCQQAVEKMLKALVVGATGRLPPRTHNLLRLAETAHLALSDSQGDFLARLGTFYIEARYPTETATVSRTISRKVAVAYLEETRGMFEWLRAQLP